MIKSRVQVSYTGSKQTSGGKSYPRDPMDGRPEPRFGDEMVTSASFVIVPL